MTKTDLIEKLYEENYCTKKDAEALVNAVFDAIRDAMVAGDKVVAGVDIRSVIAGIEKRRRRNSEMNFLCPCFPQKSDNSLAGRSPDYRIVDKDYPFPWYNA